MLIHKLLRKPYRSILKKLTIQVLKKHKPNIIAVMGDGQTAIAREVIYSIISENYPARRNLESPEAEFSVPLTIIGYPHYPKSNIEWIWVILKTKMSLKSIKPYKHFLILELNAVKEEILRYWLEITNPETVLIVGMVPVDYTNYQFSKLVKISSNQADDLLGPFKLAATQIGRFYKIDTNTIQQVLDTISLPTSKVRFFPGINGSFIIDATSNYLPVKIEAVLEMIYDDSGRRVLFSSFSKDIKYIKSSIDDAWLINPNNFIPANNDVIVLRGDRVKKIQEFENLINYKKTLI